MFGGVKASTRGVLPDIAPLALHELSFVVTQGGGTTHAGDDVAGFLPGTTGSSGNGGPVCWITGEGLQDGRW